MWDLSPRLSMAYDLFGDGRTALKASFSQYLDPLTGGFADRYAPGAANETRNWFDCTINAAGNACATGVSLPTDSDDIAQAHEIGPGGATFGIREDRDFDPAIQRERNTEITLGVQHQLFSRVSVIAQYYRRTFGRARDTGFARHGRTAIDSHYRRRQGRHRGRAPSIGGTQGPSGGGGGGPQAPAATAGPGQGSGPAPVNTPQQDFQKGFTDATKAANANPMPLNQAPLSPSAPTSAAPPAAPVYQQADTTGSTVPAAATGHSGSPATSAPASAPAPAPAAPTGAPSMPLGNPSTPTPAAPVPPSGPVGPAVATASTNQGAAAGPAAPVPISAARAERDAIAAASTAGALRRKGNNPRQLARHIGAALNVDITDPSLFWITAVTNDGQILAANNYGLAYIPEHVHLPEQVRMVTADESIPARIRGTWATYPLLAVQEWARHHNVTLQAVVGTAENLKGFDLGAARDILTPEDMPDSGKMQGRNRLEVIAPEVAAKLAGIGIAGLAELLPPAPADNTPPPDNRINLLLEVCKPLLSANPDRAGAHLKAMVAYADHLQAVALHRAHNAQDGELQRVAIAEWIYWQHISVLTSDALSAMVS